MTLLNIAKPDLLENEDYFKEYLKILKESNIIDGITYYKLDNWALNSLYLYEYDCLNLKDEEEKEKRKKLLTTAKGYDVLYPNKDALVILLHMSDNYNCFDYIKDVKKSFRKKYVYGSKANYLRFENENDIDFSKKFDKDTLLKIKADIKTYEKELKENPMFYYMVFFNMVHAPVTKSENDYELNVLKTKKLLKGM